jgi:IS30 family transposase
LEEAVMLIDKRPRKSLDYKTPFEVFYSDKLDADALQI